MRIAILSDIHDNIWNLNTLLRHIPQTDIMICCGDLCAPFVMGLLAKGYPNSIHVVFGNNDGDLYRITQIAGRFDHVHLHGEFFEAIFDERRFMVTHFPDIAEVAARSNSADVVCYGHDHQYAVRREGDVWLLNPGAVMGYDPATNSDVPATFLIYDTRLNEAEGFQVDGGGIAVFGR